MKQFFKILSQIILIPCGCLTLLAALAFLVLFFAFRASPSDIRKGNEDLKQIFTSLDMPPKKVKSNGIYKYEGGGLTFYVTFSDEVINSHPVLKESPNLTKNQLEFNVVLTGDISYYKVGNAMFNLSLLYFLEEESEKYSKKSERNQILIT